MIRIIIIVLFCAGSVRSFGQYAAIGFEYQTQSNHAGKDSTHKTLVFKEYFDKKMHLVREDYFGSHKGGNCSINLSYDPDGNLSQEITHCNKKVTNKTEYRYDTSGKMIWMKSMLTEPHTITITKNLEDSTIKETYLSEENATNGVMEIKDVDILNKNHASVYRFSINNTGDTIKQSRNLYLPLSDTATMMYANYPEINTIFFQDSLNQSQIVVKLEKSIGTSRMIQKFNKAGKLVFTQIYHYGRKMVVHESNWEFNQQNELIGEKGNDFIDGISVIRKYQHENVVSSQFYLHKTLIRTVYYEYRTIPAIPLPFHKTKYDPNQLRWMGGWSD